MRPAQSDAALAEPERGQDELILAAQAGDGEAMSRLADMHIKLVHAAAKRFPGADPGEITQSGCVGLIEAIRRFDVTRGVRFSTYAVPYILGEMRHFLRVDHSMHIPRRLQDAGRDAARVSRELCAKLGREPTIQEVALEMRTSPEELAMAMESRAAPASLDAPSGAEDGAPMHESLGDASSQSGYERVLVRDMLERCAPAERALLTMRYFRGMSQTDAAKALGISQPQASRMEKRLLARLRESSA
ncbi:MAG: sigma-70 family RNA polymerase sigma factor [Oscillospiraceae bacterium]|jgi:RNA polymerase sporulation-specific sigma factor|nr:sigma-70 family RNA polymerase sigma factor [Oscillospiraceae bacterium]